MDSDLGVVLVLNGAPRSGKSSIVEAVQASFDGVWMNLGVDAWVQVTPPSYRPGIGLRPGGERPDLEPLVLTMYAGLFESVAAHSRLGLNVVMDVGLYGPAVFDCARRFSGLPAWLVGVRCPLETILERRRLGGDYVTATPEDPLPLPVVRWQEAVHVPGVYDLEVDTSLLSPAECAAVIREFLASGVPTAFGRLVA